MQGDLGSRKQVAAVGPVREDAFQGERGGAERELDAGADAESSAVVDVVELTFPDQVPLVVELELRLLVRPAPPADRREQVDATPPVVDAAMACGASSISPLNWRMARSPAAVSTRLA